MTTPLTKKETQDAFKEAIKEWADEKYRLVGKWTVSSLAVILVVALCYFILELNGWTPPWSITMIQHTK